MNKRMMRMAITCGVACSFVASPVMADFTSGEVRIGSWNAAPSGDFRYPGVGNTDATDFDYERRWRASLGIEARTMVPMLPNIRAHYSSISHNGTMSVSEDQSSDSGVIGEGEHDLNLDLSHADVGAYYSLGSAISPIVVDTGLTLRFFDGEFFAETDSDAVSYDYKDTRILAMGRVRMEVPGTGVHLYGMGQYGYYSSEHMSDYELGLKFLIPGIDTMDAYVDVSYRQFKWSGKDGDGAFDEVTIDGVNAGMTLSF